MRAWRRSHLPKIQLSTTSYTAERGRTRTPESIKIRLVARRRTSRDLTEQQVGHGQRDDEGVGRAGELGGDLDSQDDQDVAEGDDEAYQTQRNQRADNLEHGLVLETGKTFLFRESAIIPASRLYSLYLNVQEAFNNIGIL